VEHRAGMFVFRSHTGHVEWLASASLGVTTQRHCSHTRRRHIATSNCYAPHRYGAHRYASALREATQEFLLTHDQTGANTASSAFGVQGRLHHVACMLTISY
jgi:hypothetical protein